MGNLYGAENPWSQANFPFKSLIFFFLNSKDRQVDHHSCHTFPLLLFLKLYPVGQEAHFQPELALQCTAFGTIPVKL